MSTEDDHHDSDSDSENKREEAKGIKFHFKAHRGRLSAAKRLRGGEVKTGS